MASQKGFTYSSLRKQERNSTWLDSFVERAQARQFKFQPVTVADRLEAFRLIHFQPHGLFLPEDPDLQAALRKRLQEMGNVSVEEERLVMYHALQEETALLEKDGVVGHWTGQQAVARSSSRFRIVAYGRRAGKTALAAAEATGIAMLRPRSSVWLAAPTFRLVSRAFDYAVQYVQDLGVPANIRNGVQEKLIVLPNGSRIEGVSLENILSAAGAAVDFAVVDEAAQITPEAWYRAVLPPLMDRNGGALLISSFEGEGDFFSDKVIEVRAEVDRAKALGFEYKPEWELFQAASYDVNFYAFPQGIHTKTLTDARKEMPVVDFLEQFGAQVAGARDRVYKEFTDKVHVGSYPFNSEMPVHLAIDPSSGANPYAITAIQDYKDYMVVIDELYEKGVKVEDYGPILQRKAWNANVVDGVIDSAWPHDIIRWNEMGYNVYPVKKPRVDESIVVVKEVLRNSRLYDTFYRSRLNHFLRAAGHQEDSDAFLPKEELHEVIQRVEESLAPENLTAEDIAYLKECSQFFVNRACVNTIVEFKSYSYPKNTTNTNTSENPLKRNDHLIDGIRYYIFMNRRFEEHPSLRSYMSDYTGPKEAEEGALEMPVLTSAQRQGRLWLEAHRNRFGPRGSRSYMGVA